MTRLRHIIVLGLAVLLVGLAAPAVAQDSAIDDGYGGAGTEATGGGTQGTEATGGGTQGAGAAGTEATGGNGRLPFSGLDLGLIAAGGALFVVAGIGMRRAVRTD